MLSTSESSESLSARSVVFHALPAVPELFFTTTAVLDARLGLPRLARSSSAVSFLAPAFLLRLLRPEKQQLALCMFSHFVFLLAF